MPAPVRIDRDSTCIAFDVRGERGSPVLLLHGLGGSRAAWPGVADALATRHRVLAMDLRGSGESPLGEEPLSFALLAADAVAVLEAASIDRAHVVGHSFGGVIAQEILLDYPDRILSAMLVSTSSEVGEAAAAGWLRLADVVEARGLSDSPSSRTRAFTDGYAERHPDIVEAIGRIAAAADPLGYAAQARLAACYDYTAALSAVTTPCVVVQGLADRLTAPGGSVILHRAIERSRLEMVEGVGHNAHVEMGSRFVDMANTLFDEVDAAA